MAKDLLSLAHDYRAYVRDHIEDYEAALRDIAADDDVIAEANERLKEMYRIVDEIDASIRRAEGDRNGKK